MPPSIHTVDLIIALRQKHLTPAIVFPTVAKGQARVRTIVIADHTQEDLREALETFERVGRELRLL